MKILPAALLIFSAGIFPACAGWPAKVFAPYMYVGAGDNFKLTNCADACGLKFYTLAFIIAKQEGDGTNATYHQEPSWDGRIAIGDDYYHDQINAIRARGGDVIMSFGGEAGKELANEIADPSALEAAYQQIIDQYKFTWLDFDVEGNNLDKGKSDSERRNAVLAALQKKNPGLIISFTLPVNPDGISEASQDLLRDAVKQGVKVHSANLMVMFFGKQFVGKGKSEGELGVESANTAYAQIQKIDPTIQIGLCPCLGRNGSAEEVFGLEDAKTLKAFADRTSWVCSLHYWSINDDVPKTGKKWAFAKTFQSFTH
jgi:hypothetical protein